MANWSRLQEELVGLPVAKRARHGIHFQKPDGSFVANFCGKPAHYLDNGLWRPIDTGLLATADGWFSSPHSDVIIHPDGRVKVKNSDYQQFTVLPSAKAGKLAGDKIIREFPGGEQHLIMTEDGFKEEIHVFKPTFPLEKFIAKTTGRLPSHYTAHPVTAEDAEGNSYTFTGDIAAFGAWLDKAVYPVVIDPDFSVNTGVGGDTTLDFDAPNYNHGISDRFILKGGSKVGLIRFDLSSISAGADCTAATLKLFGTLYRPSNTYNLYKIADANGDWIEGTKNVLIGIGEPCWNYKEYNTVAWAGSAGLLTAGTDYINTLLASVTLEVAGLGSEIFLPFNASGLTALEGYCGLSTNNGFLLTSTKNDGTYYAATGEYATVDYRPVLSITYSAGGVPKHFMHYQRLRSL